MMWNGKSQLQYGSRRPILPLARGLIGIGLAGCVLLGCQENASSAPTAPPQSADTGSRFILDRNELDRLSGLGLQGDATASFEVYMHLISGGEKSDPEMDGADEWLKRSADQGDPRARQHLVAGLFTRKSPENCRMAEKRIREYKMEEFMRSKNSGVSGRDIEECRRIISEGMKE